MIEKSLSNLSRFRRNSALSSESHRYTLDILAGRSSAEMKWYEAIERTAIGRTGTSRPDCSSSLTVATRPIAIPSPANAAPIASCDRLKRLPSVIFLIPSPASARNCRHSTSFSAPSHGRESCRRNCPSSSASGRIAGRPRKYSGLATAIRYSSSSRSALRSS